MSKWYVLLNSASENSFWVYESKDAAMAEVAAIHHAMSSGAKAYITKDRHACIQLEHLESASALVKEQIREFLDEQLMDSGCERHRDIIREVEPSSTSQDTPSSVVPVKRGSKK